MTGDAVVTWEDGCPDGPDGPDGSGSTGGVLVATMDRRPANALGPPIIDGLSAVLDEAERRGTRVLVLTSAIPGFFAAGADIKHLGTVDAAAFTAYGDRLRGVIERLAGADLVSIAAIEGLALGGGLELAMACTMRVSGADAAYGLPEVRLGLIPGAAGTQRLPRLVGRGRAIDIMATGRQVPAAEAAAIGLVDRLVGAGGACGAALELAGQLSALSRPALAAMVRTVDAAFDLPFPEGKRYEVEQIQELFEHGEAREGIAAFLEKRAPKFS
jgi:enoyl-CoA hydratase/carnithine racemase